MKIKTKTKHHSVRLAIRKCANVFMDKKWLKSLNVTLEWKDEVNRIFGTKKIEIKRNHIEDIVKLNEAANQPLHKSIYQAIWEEINA